MAGPGLQETSQNGDINALNASVSIVGIGPGETFKVLRVCVRERERERVCVCERESSD